MSLKPAPAGGRGGSGTGKDPSPRPRDLDPCIQDEAVKYLTMPEVQVAPSLGRHFQKQVMLRPVCQDLLCSRLCVRRPQLVFVWCSVRKAEHVVSLSP